MKTEYERDLQLWVKGLTDRELSECIGRLRLKKIGAGIAVDSTP